MKNSKYIFAVILLLAGIVALGWYFSDIVVYILIALALSFLGQPIMRLFSRIRIKNWQFPTSLAAALTMAIILFALSMVFYYLVPVIIRQFSSVLQTDLSSIGEEFQQWLNNMDPILQDYGFLAQEDHFSDVIIRELQKIGETISLSGIVSNTAHAASSLVIGLFSVLFMTFFALKDYGIFFRMIGNWIPTRFRGNFSNILNATGKQLSSYFIGVFIDMVSVGIILFILCLIFKIPNALLISFIGGLLNIIPFVGPILACLIGVVISLTSLIPVSPDSHVIMMTLIQVVGIFLATKLIDDFILQPNIYGKRTQTHPLEIFIVILMAGHVGGILFMIFAVPAYTILRIVVKEFFGAYFFSENASEESLSKSPDPE